MTSNGEASDDPAVERVVSGDAWRQFCEMLKLAGEVILRERSPRDPLDRAEGFRYLGRLTRVALDNFLEHADPLAPTLHRPVHETAKMGADNPDNYYQFAAVSGEHDYRIRGRRNTIHYLGLGTYAGDWSGGGRKAQTGYIDGSELELEPDGCFTIDLSCEPRPGNWLRMEPDTASLIVRQTFLDRDTERVAELSIERLGRGSPAGPTPLTPARLDRALRAAGMLVGGCAASFADWAEGFAHRPNQLPRFEQTGSFSALADPNITYYHGYWSIGADEALLVEFTPPPCDYWNFQLNNHWMESLDYRYYDIAVNKHQARTRPDGSVRIVVCHDPPAADSRDDLATNWLQTAGHRHGTMCLRWVRAEVDDPPSPRARIVGAAELRARRDDRSDDAR